MIEPLPAWKHMGICKVCGKHKALDCCNYCDACYPYDKACDVYKSAKVGRHLGNGEA